MSLIRPETQTIIDRLKAVDQTKPYVLNKDIISKAFYDHLIALNQNNPKRQIEWFFGLKDGVISARDVAWDVAWGAAWGVARDVAWDAARDVAWDVAWDAAWDANIENSLYDHKEYLRYKAIWMPFVDAFEAGLFIYWVFKDRIIAVPRPIFSFKGDLLHNESAPAILYPNGESYWFLNNVRVTQKIVETPAEELDVQLVVKTTNAEVRREIVRKIGIERVCQKLGAKSLDRVGDYELLLLDIGDKRNRPYLKMKNPSIGTYHIEGVSPEIKTVQEALNWRNQSSEKPEVLT